MFGQSTFSHDTLRKYVIYFGRLFDDIYINRTDQTGTVIQNMKIPLNYGPSTKFLSRAEGDPKLERQIAIQLPRMSYAMTGFYYDATRQQNVLNKIVTPGTTASTASFQYAPVPYDIEFQLYIMVKNAADGTAIVEQIIPFFRPSWTASVKINPDLSQAWDVPLTLKDVSATDTYEGNFIDRRYLIWTLTFTMKAWLFGPTYSGGKLISKIDLGFKIPPLGMSISDAIGNLVDDTITIDITPGEHANTAVNWYGDYTENSRPTTDAANTITSDSDYGYMIDFMKDVE